MNYKFLRLCKYFICLRVILPGKGLAYSLIDLIAYKYSRLATVYDSGCFVLLIVTESSEDRRTDSR